jgi:cytidylate kinase
MAQILDRDTKNVLIKLSIQEFNSIKKVYPIDDEDISQYEFILNTPISAKELLKTF